MKAQAFLDCNIFQFFYKSGRPKSTCHQKNIRKKNARNEYHIFHDLTTCSASLLQRCAKSGSLENGILRIVLPKEPKKVENSNRIEIK